MKYILKNYIVDKHKEVWNYTIFDKDMNEVKHLDATPEEAMHIKNFLALESISPMQWFNAISRKHIG